MPLGPSILKIKFITKFVIDQYNLWLLLLWFRHLRISPNRVLSRKALPLL